MLYMTDHGLQGTKKKHIYGTLHFCVTMCIPNFFLIKQKVMLGFYIKHIFYLLECMRFLKGNIEMAATETLEGVSEKNIMNL